MGASQPIASMIVTAAQRKVLTAADFQAGTPFHARISNVAFINGIAVIYQHSSAGPHYLELSPDSAKTSIAVPTDTPLWSFPTWPINQASPASHYQLDDRDIHWFPPLAASQVDLYWIDKTFGAAARTPFKPSGDILVIVSYYPTLFI
jgi:hypothetical protein